MTFSDRLMGRLSRARRVAVLTGAGISAESGVPTFRDAGGLWQRFKPEELANVEAFLANPELVQGWYQHRRSLVAETEPNPGHEALARMQDMFDSFTLITQNVDNLHERAGSRDIIELHGNIMRSYCLECGQDDESQGLRGHGDKSGGNNGDGDKGDGDGGHGDKALRRCASCGGLIRPDVVWFGEMLPEGAFERADLAARTSDVFFSVGTSAAVYPAAALPLTAAENGAYTVEVNIVESNIASYMDEVIEGPSGEVLPLLVESIERIRG